MRLDSPTTGARNSRFARRLFSGLPERYDRLAEWLSLGQNGRWRRAMVDHIVPGKPGLILDVATGTAGVALQLAARTGARVVGVDLTEAMIRAGPAQRGARRSRRSRSRSCWAEANNSPSPTPPSTH